MIPQLTAKYIISVMDAKNFFMNGVKIKSFFKVLHLLTYQMRKLMINCRLINKTPPNAQPEKHTRKWVIGYRKIIIRKL